jgi:DNA-binding response OmpR family regulator
MRNVGQPLARELIAREVWRHMSVDVETTNVVDVYVAYLRKKLDAANDAPLLHTVRGVGYVMRPAAVANSSESG